MAFVVKAPLSSSYATRREHGNLLNPSDLKIGKSVSTKFSQRVPTGRNSLVAMSVTPAQQSLDLVPVSKKNINIPIMVNGCTGKMGRAVLEAAMAAGLDPVPVALGGPEDSGKILDFGGKQIEVDGSSDREAVLSSVFNDYPNLIVVDYTVPGAVNDNAALYSKVGVPFVMGTTGGDRELLYKTVDDSKVYAVISPQMGKQVVAFLAAMEIMSEQFPGSFSGYDLQVMESHQAGKLDISGTAKAVISCFEKLGASFDPGQGASPKSTPKTTQAPSGTATTLRQHIKHISRHNKLTLTDQRNAEKNRQNKNIKNIRRHISPSSDIPNIPSHIPSFMVSDRTFSVDSAGIRTKFSGLGSCNGR